MYINAHFSTKHPFDVSGCYSNAMGGRQPLRDFTPIVKDHQGNSRMGPGTEQRLPEIQPSYKKLALPPPLAKGVLENGALMMSEAAKGDM